MKTNKEVTLVKIGGNVIDDAEALTNTLMAFANIKGPKILVHGGGKEASRMAQKLGIQPQMIDGRRITDAPMLDVAVMTYAGLLNKKIVAQLQALGTSSIGFSGADGNLILSEKRKNTTTDFGFVGDVVSVNDQMLSMFLEEGIVPVFCAITHDGAGQLLNTNADTITSALGVALSGKYSVKITYCFEKKGVLINTEDDNSVISTITQSKYNDLIAIGAIHSGMIPKLDNCFYALSKGVQQIIIGHHSVIGESNALYTTIQL
ncbi:acetylglutamate kinase [Flavobacterium humi]|uniref:Acetylglutamate kinase n=1 Tax=Flavobacterium humi TaxID=2562683 RepID=A0A4Z0LAC2_9FLAO|nr:acetylglutamate kinase [Flavobacterium humi]TGD58230.1 acetylglutamate kinase [Flavobacterium humi]